MNTASLAANRTFVHRTGPFAFDVSDVGINAYTYLKKTFYLSGMSGAGGAGGISGQGGTQTEATNNTNTFSLSDSVTVP